MILQRPRPWTPVSQRILGVHWSLVIWTFWGPPGSLCCWETKWGSWVGVGVGCCRGVIVLLFCCVHCCRHRECERYVRWSAMLCFCDNDGVLLKAVPLSCGVWGAELYSTVKPGLLSHPSRAARYNIKIPNKFLKYRGSKSKSKLRNYVCILRWREASILIDGQITSNQCIQLYISFI